MVGSLGAAAWVLVPLILDARWTNLSPVFSDDFWLDSFGAGQALSWLFSGELFDAGRVPIISALAGAGIACALWQRAGRRGAATVGVVGVVSLVLFFGRPTLGPLVDLLPGGRDLMLPRFLMGVQVAGVMFAGLGLIGLARSAYSLLARLPRARYPAYGVVLLAALGVVAVPAAERYDYHKLGATGIARQRVADATDGEDVAALLDIVKVDGGRAYAGSRVNWGESYRVGSVPIYAELANRSIDALGFTYRTISSLSSDLEPRFDDSDISEYDLYNVRYLILPTGSPPPVDAAGVDTEGRHTLWSVDTSGFLRMIDTGGEVRADRTSVARASEAFLAGDGVSRGIFPTVAFDGAPSGPSSASGSALDPPGEVLQQVAILEQGHVVGRVRANRRGVVLLKASFHPRWSATIDGHPADVFMVAPSLMGVAVEAGEHVVEFRYIPFRYYGVLGALGALVLLQMALLMRRGARPARLGRRRG